MGGYRRAATCGRTAARAGHGRDPAGRRVRRIHGAVHRDQPGRPGRDAAAGGPGRPEIQRGRGLGLLDARHRDLGRGHPRPRGLCRAPPGTRRPPGRPAASHRPGAAEGRGSDIADRAEVAGGLRLRGPGRRAGHPEVPDPDHRPVRHADTRGARSVTDGAMQARQPVRTAPGSGPPDAGAAPGTGPAAQAAAGAGTAIRTQDLRKTYKTPRGDVPAVRGIDLTVPAGELFGLLGPNGAGKSTTIGMLTTLVLPTGGRAWVAGLDVAADPVGVKRRIGVVTQNNTLDMQLTVAENLEFRSRFFGLGPREAARRAGQLIDAFGLGERRTAMATDLSGGQARRLLIARALVHRPQVLFLDEPTAGLDPQTRVNLWDILRVLHGQGQSILLTTHYMEEAEALCDRIAVVDHGKVLAEGTVRELTSGAGADTVITVRYQGPVPGGLAAATGLAGRPGVGKVEADHDRIRVFAA